MCIKHELTFHLTTGVIYVDREKIKNLITPYKKYKQYHQLLHENILYNAIKEIYGNNLLEKQYLDPDDYDYLMGVFNND